MKTTEEIRNEMLSPETKKVVRMFETFGEVIPKLSESDKSYLLGLGEGMAIKTARVEKQENEERPLT